ncbi:MAG: hypothetical protein JWN86_3584 [Planctomycetota bacterium]|nr:hypothetical protein [Planctomycetota bacterium]
MGKEKARALTPEEQTKTIIVEFDDGPEDGTEFRSDSDDLEEAEEALRFYLVHSDGGRIGEKYRTTSTADIETTRHIYEVVDRQDDETTIRVRFQYLGAEE